MPRFYFHARGASHQLPDHIGDELPDAESARDLAVQAIRDITSDPLDCADYSSWVIEIADERGQTLLTVPFRTGLRS